MMPRSTSRNQKAKVEKVGVEWLDCVLIASNMIQLAADYNELLKELSSTEMSSVGYYRLGETIGQVRYRLFQKKDIDF